MAGQIQVLNQQWILNIVPEESGLEGTGPNLVEVENLANRLGCVSGSTAQDPFTAMTEVDSTLVSLSNMQAAPDLCVTGESNGNVIPMAVITIGEPDRNLQPHITVPQQLKDSPDVMKFKKLKHILTGPDVVGSFQVVSDGVSDVDGNVLSDDTQAETSVVKLEQDDCRDTTPGFQFDDENRVFMGAYLAHEIDQNTSEVNNPRTVKRRGSYKSKTRKTAHVLSGKVKPKKALQSVVRSKDGRPKKHADDFDYSLDNEVEKKGGNPGDFMTTEQKLELCRYTEKYGKKESAEIYSKQWNLKITERCAECCLLKYSTLKEIHGREPTTEEYDRKHKWLPEDKVIIAKYGMEHGATEAARHFSKVYEVYINESSVRNYIGSYRRKFLE